ncbi:hypothetical protein ACNPM4_06705, partial [Microbacterium sp. AGC62]
MAEAAALAVVAPLSRRAARQRQTTDDTVVEPPFIAPTPEPIIADVPASPVAVDKVEQIIEIATGDEAHAAAEPEPATDLPLEDDADAFERASRAFRTGSIPTVDSAAAAFTARKSPAADSAQPEAPVHVVARRPRSFRKVVAVGASVGVMSLAGLLA